MKNPQLFLHLCLLSTGAASAQAAPGDPGPREAAPRWQGQYFGEAEAGARVVTEAHGWARLWKELGRTPPPLDFSRWCVVAAFAGQQPTGGFTLEIQEPVPEGEDLLVRWRVRPPAPGSIVTEALARPWVVKALPRPRGAVRLLRLDD